ncbi:MAG: 3'(2'),5'-bisphosphate nucleotidase CysQ [Arenicellales bacterium WSBS_2016_MAG_OTU3]
MNFKNKSSVTDSLALHQLLPDIVAITKTAGAEILDVYNNDFDVEDKQDGSPLTLADKRAHLAIVAALAQLTPAIPVLSEESPDQTHKERLGWSRYWLVDPLDGTKEFVKRNGEFTVNIALIDNREPVLGVVYTPVKQITHYAARGFGAFKQMGETNPEPISVRRCADDAVTMVASRSHAGSTVDLFKGKLENTGVNVSVSNMGSSLKICLVAEGSADIYPRLGPTSEWDTAAAQNVLEVAGGTMTDTDGQPLRYNKENILNPFFLAFGKSGRDWRDYLS